jgi:hypothetical protein
MKPEQPSARATLLNQIALGVVAFDGLIIAALVSGLPSVSFFALADAYFTAIVFFALSATSAAAPARLT